MNPWSTLSAAKVLALPRVCGDEPSVCPSMALRKSALPRVCGDEPTKRGRSNWSLAALPRVCGDEPVVHQPVSPFGLLCPAYAGMNPTPSSRLGPHPLCPAYAGMNPYQAAVADRQVWLCPAYAGMNPRTGQRPACVAPALPRVCGDEPASSPLNRSPALPRLRAGMNPCRV